MRNVCKACMSGKKGRHARQVHITEVRALAGSAVQRRVLIGCTFGKKEWLMLRQMCVQGACAHHQD